MPFGKVSGGQEGLCHLYLTVSTFVHLYIPQYTCPYISMPVGTFVYPWDICMSVVASAYLSVHFYIHPDICHMSIHLSVCLDVHSLYLYLIVCTNSHLITADR